MTKRKLPNVAILATGGTISAKGGSSTQMTGYTSGLIGVEALVDAVPEIQEFANISGEQITNVSSPSLTFDILTHLAKRVNELLASPDIDGVVITHGTSTIEETAYLLNLVVRSDKPVVFTGAMRPATAISADGSLNLLNAVMLAAHPDSVGKGVLVALNNHINASREVTKTNTMSVETFKAPEIGILGYIQNSVPYFFRTTSKRHTAQSEFSVDDLADIPRVDIVYGYLHDDTVHVDAAVAAGAKGIVIASPGHGTMSAAIKQGLVNAQKQGVVIVKTSRCGSGLVTRVADDDKTNFVAGGYLNAQKARILLMLALTKTSDSVEVQRIFNEY